MTSATPQASQRVVGFDIARGVAVLGMILIHVQRHWAQPEPWAGLPNLVLAVLGGPLAAPVFMLVMGASVAWSRRTDHWSLARRGLLLLAAGLALNIARGTLPLVVGQAAGVLPPEGVGEFTAWSLLVTVDVLQLAGSSLVAIALLRPLIRRGAGWVAAAVAVVTVAPMLRPVQAGVPLLDGALGVLWATGPSVYYPFFPWAVFPLLGIALGLAVRRDPGTWPAWRRPLVRWGLAGVAMAIAGGALMGERLVTLDTLGYWQLEPVLALTLSGVALAWVAACAGIARLAAGTAPVRMLTTWGRGVTRMYVAHWLIVSWGLGFVGYLALPLPATLAAMAGVLLATHVIAISATSWLATRRDARQEVADASEDAAAPVAPA
jgi:uncharacterized membrane protein